MRAWVPFEELVTEPVSPAAPIELTLYSGDGVPPSSADVEFFVLPTRGLPASLTGLSGMRDLKVLQLLSSGTDHVLSHVPAGVTVCNAASLHAKATAEVAMSLILASLNEVPAWVASQQAGLWSIPAPRPGLAGKTVLLLGFGEVGKALSTMLSGFDVDVVPVARRERHGVTPVTRLRELLPGADIVVLAALLTERTRGLINDDTLRQMRDGALLVNISRGPIVDTEALLTHVQSGRILAALDVTEPEPLPSGHPLWRCPGVLISPHVGGQTADFRHRAVEFLRDQLSRYANGKPLRQVVRAGSHDQGRSKIMM